jgi:hypothetical protein
MSFLTDKLARTSGGTHRARRVHLQIRATLSLVQERRHYLHNHPSPIPPRHYPRCLDHRKRSAWSRGASRHEFARNVQHVCARLIASQVADAQLPRITFRARSIRRSWFQRRQLLAPCCRCLPLLLYRVYHLPGPHYLHNLILPHL